MPQHPKIAQLSDTAFRLTVTAWAWCVELRTDGKLPKGMVSALTRAPQGKLLARTVGELLDSKLWHDRGDYFEVHDFLSYNMSSAQYEAKARAGSSGGYAKAGKAVPSPGKSLALARQVPKQNAGDASSKSLAESESESESEISVSQISGPDRSSERKATDDTSGSNVRVVSGVRDPCRMSFDPVSPEALALFEAYRETSGKGGAKLDGKARELFERLAYESVTPPDVVLVVEGAKLDPWARDSARLSPSAILGSAEQRAKFSDIARRPPPTKAKHGQSPPQPNSGYQARVIND